MRALDAPPRPARRRTVFLDVLCAGRSGRRLRGNSPPVVYETQAPEAAERQRRDGGDPRSFGASPVTSSDDAASRSATAAADAGRPPACCGFSPTAQPAAATRRRRVDAEIERSRGARWSG